MSSLPHPDSWVTSTALGISGTSVNSPSLVPSRSTCLFPFCSQFARPPSSTAAPSLLSVSASLPPTSPTSGSYQQHGLMMPVTHVPLKVKLNGTIGEAAALAQLCLSSLPSVILWNLKPLPCQSGGLLTAASLLHLQPHPPAEGPRAPPECPLLALHCALPSRGRFSFGSRILRQQPA